MKRLLCSRIEMSAVVLCCFISALFLVSNAQSSSKLEKNKLSDGVEYWRRLYETDGQSFFLKKLEEIYNITFSNKAALPFGKSVAFLVGVSTYNKITPNLPSVNNDIEEMRKFLIDKAGFDEVYVARDGIVNRDLIEKYIKATLSDKLQENDRLLFYYSGHGADNKGKTGYMQFGGAEKGVFYGAQVLPINALEDWSKELRVKHVLFILDCCASGLAFVAKAGNDESDPMLLKTLSGNGSRTVLTAGTADEKTYALASRTDIGNGVFTKAFLNSFDSHAITHQSNGLITISDIYANIEKEMARFRMKEGKATTPKLWTLQEMDYRGTFVFLNPQANQAKFTREQEKMLGITIPKGHIENIVGQGEGIIEVSSTYGGTLIVDGNDKGRIEREQVRTFFKQPGGKHTVEIHGTKKENRTVAVESGRIAYVRFGQASPFNKSGSGQNGKLEVHSKDGIWGKVFLNEYEVGLLRLNETLIVAGLVPGQYKCRIEGNAEAKVEIVTVEAGKTTDYIPKRPMPPMNLTVH